MSNAEVMDIMRVALMVAIKLCAPILLLSMLVGVLISILQAATQKALVGLCIPIRCIPRSPCRRRIACQLSLSDPLQAYLLFPGRARTPSCMSGIFCERVADPICLPKTPQSGTVQAPYL